MQVNDLKYHELEALMGQLRNWFLTNNVEPPIALVLSDRNAMTLMKSMKLYPDHHWLSHMSVANIQLRFEPNK